MKELSIEEKAKAYDNALQVLHKYDGANIMFSYDLKMEMFPELKESDDERIRKELIRAFNSLNTIKVWNGIERTDILAWLEKQGEQKSIDDLSPQEAMDIAVAKCFEQGEQKPIIEMKSPEESLGIDSDTYNKIVDECIYGEQNPTDKVEPKFKVGDKIQYLKGCGTIITIEKIENGEYIFANNLGHTTIEDGNKWYLVEHKSADKPEPKFKVKYAGSEYNVFETKDIAGVTFYGIEDEPNHIDYVKADNCKIISGYGIKESGLSFPTKPVMFSEQETAWSEEDEEMLNMVIKSCEQCGNEYAYYWLKSLKDRVQPQSQWKPSDEQMKLLKELVEDNNQRYFYTLLRSLYVQLKILKGK